VRGGLARVASKRSVVSRGVQQRPMPLWSCGCPSISPIPGFTQNLIDRGIFAQTCSVAINVRHRSSDGADCPVRVDGALSRLPRPPGYPAWLVACGVVKSDSENGANSSPRIGSVNCQSALLWCYP